MNNNFSNTLKNSSKLSLQFEEVELSLKEMNEIKSEVNESGDVHNLIVDGELVESTPEDAQRVMTPQDTEQAEGTVVSDQRDSAKLTYNKDIERKVRETGEYVDGVGKAMLDWFSNHKLTKTVVDTSTWKDGSIKEKKKEKPLPPPMFSEYAREKLGVPLSKLKSWYTEHDKFAAASEDCRAIMKEFIVKNGLMGHYPSTFSKFVAKNETDMKDEVINKNQNTDINKFLDKLERGEIK